MQPGNHEQSPNAASFRRLAQHAPCVVWVADPSGAWSYVNPAWAALTGQSVEAACGLGWLDRMPDSDRVRLKAAFLQSARTGESFEIEHDVWTEHAGVKVVVSRAHPEMLDGVLAGFCGSCSVLDKESDLPVEQQEKLFRNQRELETLVENSPDVIARLGRDLRHIYINRAVHDAFGIEAPSVIGKTVAELGFPPAVAHAYDQAAVEVFDGGEERAFNFSIESDDARSRHFTTRVLPEFDHRRRVESVLAVTYDVTLRTEAQRERDGLLVKEQAARQQAEASARARDQFLSIVSHELRSPLNGIQSWTHVLENRVGSDSPAIARAITGIKTGVQQQVRMIEELLDTTRVMTGRLRIAKAPFVLNAAIDAAVARASTAASDRNVSIELHLPAEPVQLVGNADRIEQIIWNLLTNAIKFSPNGSRVLLSVERGDIDVRISVSDEGKGIAPEFMPYLFDAFRQADSSNTRRAEGLGLGLTLVRHLTELHGGRAVAHSEGENLGSVFSIYLPLRSTPEAEDEAPRAISAGAPERGTLDQLRDIRILLVDDHKEARDSLSELLKQGGAGVVSCASGEEAVDYLKQCNETDAPQVLICDIAMPGQDGYATLQQIRQLERQVSTRYRASIPAIALTAFAQREDRLRALRSGFQVYLTKPASPSELVATIASLTAGAAERTASPHSAQA